MEFIHEVDRYNDQMQVGREKKDRLKIIGRIYCIVSPILALLLGFQKIGVIVTAPFSTNISSHIFIIGCVLNIASYIFFALYKENYIAAAAFSFTLGFLHNPFFVVALFNGVMAVIYQCYKIKLMKLRGYPVFQDIRIVCHTIKEPNEAEALSDDTVLNERNNYC